MLIDRMQCTIDRIFFARYLWTIIIEWTIFFFDFLIWFMQLLSFFHGIFLLLLLCKQLIIFFQRCVACGLLYCVRFCWCKNKQKWNERRKKNLRWMVPLISVYHWFNRFEKNIKHKWTISMEFWWKTMCLRCVQ